MDVIRTDDEIDALKLAALESLEKRGMTVSELCKSEKFTAGYEQGLADALDWITGDTDVDPFDFLPEDVVAPPEERSG